MALTKKQQKFIEEYFVCGMNATQAAINAGYSEKTARSIGHENLTKPDIKAEIDRIFQENTMPAGEVLTRLTEQARGDIGDFFNDTGILDIKKARELGKTRLIKKVKRTVSTYTDEQGNGKESFTDEIELYSSQSALQILARRYGLLTEKVEHSGTVQWEVIREDDSTGDPATDPTSEFTSGTEDDL
jgi:phage terminase small subunit